MKNPIILDNIFSEKYMNEIEDACLKSSWMYFNDITFYENSINQNGFALTFDNNSSQYFLLQYLIFKSCQKINFEVKEILRVRKRLTYPNKEKYNIPCNQHVDDKNKHIVLLYYVNNSNGDTFVYNKESKNNNDKKFSSFKKVEFKRGRVVIFNGKNYHASSLSSNNPRIVLNINLQGKFIK